MLGDEKKTSRRTKEHKNWCHDDGVKMTAPLENKRGKDNSPSMKGDAGCSFRYLYLDALAKGTSLKILPFFSKSPCLHNKQARLFGFEIRGLHVL